MPMINSKTSTQSDSLVPLSQASARFGYADSQHFRQAIAQRHGIRPVRVGNRWFVRQLELGRAFDAVTAPKAPAASPDTHS